MKLSDNIKRIRKENNLSQEQLAEKLGVSRQSVSKWESGQSYPEMDKMLKICDMFNYNINDLLNENINEVKEEKQSKNNFNKYVDDFFAYVTKAVKMFASLKLSQKLKCIFEQLCIAFVLQCICLIIGGIGISIFSDLFSWIPHNVYLVFLSIVKSIYLIMFLLFSIVVFLHIFKVRYLDYYEIIENDTESNFNETTKEEKEDTNNRIKLIDNKREKIIIRDPKDSDSKFLSGILKLIMLGVKAFVCFITLWLLIFLAMCFIALVCSFMIAKSGLLFIGVLIIIIAAIVGDLVFIEIAYNIITNKKSKKIRLALQFLGSVIAVGIGIGLIFVEITNFNFESADILERDEYIISMKDNTYVERFNSVKFVEDDRDSIKIVVLRDKYSTSDVYEYNGCISIHNIQSEYEFFNMIRDLKSCIINKRIPYMDEQIIIYASKENISKMQQNYIDARNKQEYEYYINQIEKKDSKIEELEEEIETLTTENEIQTEELLNQIKILNEKLPSNN